MFGSCLYLPMAARRLPPFCSDQVDELPLDLSWKSQGSKAVESGEDVATSDAEAERKTPEDLSKPPTVLVDPVKEEREEVADDVVVEAATSSAEIVPRKGRERSLLPCQVCGKAFDRPSLLKRHIRTHTGEKPHVCDVCGKGFSTSSSLNTHRRIHSGEKPHECPVCGKRFTASSNLYYHRMTHVKEKPHKCTMCNKSFPTPGDLKSHMYVHNGSWPFQCHVCQRGFSKQTNLRNHLFLHTGKKPHTCSQCGKSFALACNLRAHLRTHADAPQPPSGRSEDKSATGGTPLAAADGSASASLMPSDAATSIFWQNFQQHLAKNILVNRVHHLGFLSPLNYPIQ